MRLDNQYASDDCDEHCVDCGDDSNHQSSTFFDDHASLACRDYAKLLASVGGLTVVVSPAASSTGLTRVSEHSYTGPVYSDGTYLVDDDGGCIGESVLSEGEKMTVFLGPRSDIERVSTPFVRHMEDAYGGATNPEYTVSGYAAYSKICTHTGCTVSDEDEATLVCLCHFGKFDPIVGAKVVGGPLSRVFPQLPIMLPGEGNFIATGDFNGPIGPGGE